MSTMLFSSKVVVWPFSETLSQPKNGLQVDHLLDFFNFEKMILDIKTEIT
jgi:hypothetical protein